MKKCLEPVVIMCSRSAAWSLSDCSVRNEWLRMLERIYIFYIFSYYIFIYIKKESGLHEPVSSTKFTRSHEVSQWRCMLHAWPASKTA